MSTCLDDIIRQSLTEFVGHIFATRWRGKEREAVSLYAFGFLLNHCRTDTILYDPRQIGIEVRVPRPSRLGVKPEVCKDLVIWPQPDMTCWDAAGPAVNYPLAVLEWKMDKISAFDIHWLRELTADAPQVTGYAVCIGLHRRDFRLSCTRVQNTAIQSGWLLL